MANSDPKWLAAMEELAGSPHAQKCEGFGARRLRFKCNCHVWIAKDALTQAKELPSG